VISEVGAKCPKCGFPVVDIVQFIPEQEMIKKNNEDKVITQMIWDGDCVVEDAKCKHYCLPTCHPEQIEEENKYGCLNKRHHTFVQGDFVPIVNCEGNPENCDIAIRRTRELNELRMKEIKVGY